MRAEFFLAGMVERGDEEGGRILLGDNTDRGAVMLRPIGLQYFGVRTTPGFPCTVYIHVYSVPTCAKCRFRQTFQNAFIAKECIYSHSDGARIERKPVTESKRVPHGFAGALRGTPYKRPRPFL
jgi:hypothetical protein